MIQTKIVSSMEKCFADSDIQDYPALTHLSALKNERVSFQLLYIDDADDPALPLRATNHRLQIDGIDRELASMRQVNSVPVTIPSLTEGGDENFLRTAPGLYPDVLVPLQHSGPAVMRGHLQAVWVELDLCERLSAGEHTVTLKFVDKRGETLSKNALTLTVIDALLPPQKMILTQWFHCDCLANYYNVAVWSDEHWHIVESFAATAARNGINMLLTPVHTPPLDTAVGGERTTTQLVDVTLENGEYSFGFDKLDRWIDMCNRVGIQYLEIAHPFTQWGGSARPQDHGDRRWRIHAHIRLGNRCHE